MLLPLFIQLKEDRPDTKITLVFMEDRVHSDLRRDPFLSGEVARVVDSEHRLRKGRERSLDGVLTAVALVRTLTRIAGARRPVLLHSRDKNSPAVRLLRAAVKFKGGPTYQHFAGMPLTMNRSDSAAPGRRGDKGDTFLCFSEHDIAFMGEVGYDRVIPVGYPRLYPAWMRRVREVADDLLASERRKLGLPDQGRHLAVFLGSMVKGLYSQAELANWLRDVLAVSQAIIPDAPVLIKPHPVENPQVLKMLEESVAELESTALTHLHPGVLASGARLVVAHHTSTIIDAMALGAPTIQYQELTPHWLERHPEGSSFLGLGPLWARNRQELEVRFEEALSEGFVVPDVRVPLKHRKDLSILIEGAPSDF